MKSKSAAILFLSILCLTGCSIGRTISILALCPHDHGQDFAKTMRWEEGRYPGIGAWYDSLRTAGVFRDTVITGENGARLHAVYAGREDADGSALILHGYKVNHIMMLHLARAYRDTLHFNVLLPDMQYHGLSGGQAASLGWYDHFDALRWTSLMHGMWDEDFIVMHGLSMGAAATMMLSGEPDLPPYIRCFVEDCGFTSVWDQFDTLRRRYPIVGKKSLQKASDWCKMIWGWDFKEASPEKMLRNSTRPMLFIHGDRDNFIPVEFARRCYDAKTSGYKELWIAPDTRIHAVSFLTNQEEYTRRLRNFIDRVRSGK